MACITEASAGFPGFSARIPFENGIISEVLNERGWNTYAVGKWHLTPGEEIDLRPGGRAGHSDAASSASTASSAARRTSGIPTSCTTTTPVDQPAPPEDGYHLSKDLTDKAIEFVRDAKVVAPEKPWYMYFCPGAPTRRITYSRSGPTATVAASTRGTRPSGQRSFSARRSLGCFAADVALAPINPHDEPNITGPDGQPWPQLDFVRPWESLRADEKRLFVRMAEVFAGFVSYTDERDRPADRLPRGVRAAR